MSGKIKKNTASVLFDIANYTLLVLLSLAFLYPLVYVLSVSISDTHAIATGRVMLWPVGFQRYGYMVVLSDRSILRAYLNTIFYSLSGTVISLLLTAITAYPLSNKKFYGRGIVTLYFAFTMFFSGGMIPTFLLIRGLHMYDTIWAIIIPGALGMWNIIIMRTNFQTLPEELRESAYLDGANNWRILFQIVLPLSKPILATLGLFCVVAQWNNFFGPLLYLSNQKLFPLQVVLRKLIITQEMRGTDIEATMSLINDRLDATLQDSGLVESVKMAAVIVSIGPIILAYPFIQKYFVKGVLIGSIKG